MNRSVSAHSDEKQKKVKKTKSVDKIKGFSKAVAARVDHNCCTGHNTQSGERKLTVKKVSKLKENQTSQQNSSAS